MTPVTSISYGNAISRCANDTHRNFIERHLFTRIMALTLIPLHFATSILDTFSGAVYAVINVGCTATLNETTANAAFPNLYRSNDLIAGPFAHLIQLSNPKHDCFNCT